MSRNPTITPELLIRAYASGIFPMAFPEEHDQILWLSPNPRAVLPLDEFHVPRSVRRLLREQAFSTTTDVDFDGVLRGCARRPETWISSQIIDLYSTLCRRGQAHSIEVWQSGRLVGGLYGLAIGGAFFGESMFSEVSNASKIALVDLVARLKLGCFRLLDTQYLTPHLEQFGGSEIDRDDFLQRLDVAVTVRTEWVTDPGPLWPEDRTL